MFSGAITALITPFKGKSLDEKTFQTFVEWQINQGIDGLVPCGTTGESPVLSHSEHKKVIELCVESANGRVPVIAGTGSNSTEEAINLTKHASKAGVDAALVVTPYYNKPNQNGLYDHFLAVADSVDLPIIIYNIPSRSIVDMSIETMQKLSEHTNIVGVKDATGDLSRALSARIEIGADFCLLSGDDVTAVAFLAQGGHGCISVCSNVAPSMNALLYSSWREKEFAEVWRLRDILHPLNLALFAEPNPTPVKFACSLLGKCKPDVRLPMVAINQETMIKVKNAMRDASLID